MRVESYSINFPICFLSLICGILSNKTIDIVTCDDNIGASPRVLNSSYKLFVRKHVVDIMITTIYMLFNIV